MGIFLLCIILLVRSQVISCYDVLLTSSPDRVLNEETITLICKVNSSLKLPSVTWYRNKTDIFSTSWKPNSVILTNHDQLKPVAGRFITTMHGSNEHHVVLTANQDLDNDLPWRCGTAQYQSNVLVMSVVSPTSSTPCDESAGCVLGVSAGVVFFVLLCTFLIAFCKGQIFVRFASKSPVRKNLKDLGETESPYVPISEAGTEDAPTTIVHKL